MSSANSLFAWKNGAVRAGRAATPVLAALGLVACGEQAPPYYQGYVEGNGVSEVLPHLWPVALFVLVVAAIALLRYRETLD